MKNLAAIALFISLGFSFPVFGQENLSKSLPQIADDIKVLYEQLKTDIKPDQEAFSLAIEGYRALSQSGSIKPEKTTISLIDFNLSANKKRMWIFDAKTGELHFHCLVAHGKNTGNEYATHFSNTPDSKQSSLGFYITGQAYTGKHGYSLKLHGKDKGVNDKALSRAIVLHGANYVSEDFIKSYGRLGRSFGCPAVPTQLSQQIIDRIKGGACLFIYHSSYHPVLKQVTLPPTQ